MTGGGSTPVGSTAPMSEGEGDRTDRDALAVALARLGIDRSAGAVARWATAAGVAVGSAGLTVALLTPAPITAALLAAGLGIGTRQGVLAVPRVAASVRRSRALGEVPALIARATLRVRVEPTAEAAAAAASDADGRLAESLGAHVRRARGTGRSGLSSFADDWADPALRRSVRLVAAAARAPADERERVLDRALSAALEGTRERAAEATASLHGPATALYAFGVLLPLSLVAGLPAARAAGIPVSAVGIAVVYDLLLPVGLCLAAAWLFARRPVAFPPASVSRDHPEVASRPKLAIAAGVAAALVGAAATTVLGVGWAIPVAPAGTGIGAALVARHRPALVVRERARAVESGLPDALAGVGRRVREGVSVERAIGAAGEETAGPTGAVLTAAARRGRRLGTGVERSFLGRHGALATVPSARARSVARLLAVAAREGRPAGTALTATADHLDDLRSAEREIRRELASVTRTLRNTAAVFAPIVGGAAVALAGRLGGNVTGFGGTPVATSQLGLAVGAYVLALAVLLTALATGLARGLDRTLVGYRVGIALCSATTLFVLAFVVTRAAA